MTSIFEKAFVGSTDYDRALAEPRTASSMDAKSIFETLADSDLRVAADVLHPVYKETDTADGYVSMEVAPELAHDTAGTVAEEQASVGERRAPQPDDQGARHRPRARPLRRPDLAGDAQPGRRSRREGMR